jgi:hypothetical protein
MLPASLAPALGIDLANDCDELPCSTAGGEITQHVFPGGLEVEIQAMRLRIGISAAFNPHLPIVLLGRLDFFSHFRRVSFDERAQTFELEPHSGSD